MPYSLNLDSTDNGFEGAVLLLSLHHGGVYKVELSTTHITLPYFSIRKIIIAPLGI